jgi:hypothetical protein
MRKWVISFLAVLLVLVGFVLPVLLSWPSKVTRANYDRIEVGMTRTEVEAIWVGQRATIAPSRSLAFSSHP